MHLIDILRPSHWEWAVVDRAEEKRIEAEKTHREAREKLAEVEKQADKLKEMDRRNHYSEALHASFRRKRE